MSAGLLPISADPAPFIASVMDAARVAENLRIDADPDAKEAAAIQAYLDSMDKRK